MIQITRFRFQATGLLKRIDVGLILATLLTLFIIQNLWQPGLPAAADIPIHLYRTIEYGRAWSPGVILPRWAPNLAYGYGYPLFVFAPPLPYLLGLGFHLAGLTFEAALKSVLIGSILLYAAGMYVLARDLFRSAAAGLVAATAFAFAPLALREALLYGGNVPQYLAIGLFPWTLWAMTRSASAQSWVWAVLAAIFYAGVVLSHLFQVLVFTPVVGMYGLLLIGLHRRPDGFDSPVRLFPRSFRVYIPLATIPLGLLLSAFFWLPAFVERYYTRAQADIFLEKSPYFVRYPHWTELVAWIQPLDARAANPYVPLTLSLITLALAGLGLLAGLLALGKPKSTRPNITEVGLLPFLPIGVIFLAVLIAGSAIFLTLPISQTIWQTITILQVAEFPWRMLGLANLGLALLAGAALLLPPPHWRWPLAAGCVLLQLFSVAPLLYPVTAFAHYTPATIADQIKYERSSQSIGTTTLGEYLPQAVTQPPTTSPLVKAFEAGDLPPRLDYENLPENTTATRLEQTAVTHRYRLNSPTNVTLRMFQFDYPGWRALLDDQPVPIRPEPNTGLILIDIPAGQHTVTLHFGETPLRLTALAITTITILSLLLTGVFCFIHPLTKNQPPTANYQPSIPHPTSPIPHLTSHIALLSLIIIIAAVWLKPLLRPVFTIESPPDQALAAQHQTKIDFENGISLIGYDVSQTVVAPGGYMQVVLYWQTKAAPYRTNLQPFVHLDRLDDLTTIADATNYTPGDVTTESNLPTFHWDNARYIRDEHDLFIPSGTPPIAYSVRVGLIDPDQHQLIMLADASGDTAQLTTINVSPVGPQPPHLAQPLDVTFGNNQTPIQLTGFELDSLTPSRLDFRLAWQTGARLQTDYTVFAQLLDLDQNRVAGFDRLPLDGAYPASTWLPGQTIIDPRTIPLDHVDPGEYRLIVGLYDSTSQERLTTASGDDYFELTKIMIGEP
ncbi:MAG TPA: hypothetical protein VGD99_19390 [Anaerolineae bacterium]